MDIPNYLAEIESEFSRIRGKWSPLSPMDWQLADSWEQKGIPLHVVLNAMSEVFRKFESSKKGGKINGLSYFTQEVERKFAEWSAAQVGKSEDSEEVENVSFGDHIIGRLETIKWQIIENISSTPEWMHPELINIQVTCDALIDVIDSAKSEAELQRLKSSMDQTILANLTDEEYDELRSAFLKKHKLSHHSKFAVTEQIVCREFREKYNLPDLTLYEL